MKQEDHYSRCYCTLPVLRIKAACGLSSGQYKQSPRLKPHSYLLSRQQSAVQRLSKVGALACRPHYGPVSRHAQ
ncbi:hypothetical protein HNY73_021976 [Argiope bruennichi]|uniref:Uncharacterized protein n=1 Tax=Argiope bruennichi TaxID=94029 RepID=A0A8T0E1P5_ARGBR|nr:hypothetical protein HNY73_021976 [Argiope bruennichi]